MLSVWPKHHNVLLCLQKVLHILKLFDHILERDLLETSDNTLLKSVSPALNRVPIYFEEWMNK